jgi:hypothetical protein
VSARTQKACSGTKIGAKFMFFQSDSDLFEKNICYDLKLCFYSICLFRFIDFFVFVFFVFLKMMMVVMLEDIECLLEMLERNLTLIPTYCVPCFPLTHS